MLNPRLAGRYAKSLVDLAKEKDQLETVHKDVLFLQSLCKSSREFVSLLRSPVIKPEKKDAIVKAVTAGRISELTTSFIRLLVHKTREWNLPEIITAFIEQYNAFKNIYPLKLTTAVPVSDEVKQVIVQQVQKQTAMKNIDLTATVDESIIGGFVLEVGGSLIDASIAYDLNKVKAQFLNNDFIYKIR